MSEHVVFFEQAQHARFVQEALRLVRLRIANTVERAKVGVGPAEELLSLEDACARELAIEGLASHKHWPLSRLALSETEHCILWVLIAHELCPWSRVQLRGMATEQEVDVTRDVLSRVVYGQAPDPRGWYELSPAGRLRSMCLVEEMGAPDSPARRATFRIARRVLALVHGQIATDEELDGVLDRRDTSRAVDELVVDIAARDQLARCVSEGAPFVVLAALTGSGRRSLALAALRAAGHEALVLDARKLPHDPAAARRLLRVFARECRLLRRRPVILHAEALGGSDQIPDRLDLLDLDLGGPCIATASRALSRRWARPPIQIELPPLSGRDRERLWKRALPAASDGDAELLSTIYPLAPALVESVGQTAMREAGGTQVDAKHVALAIRTVLDDRLAGLARRLTVTQDWKDLVLPEDQTMSVIEFLARVRSRRRVYEDWGFAQKLGKGLGVTALFSGPPGTGKTMCAGLIAKDLGTEVYQVELNKIVSKWIGETEKNLAALFDAAEASHAVLLFDEADSLFGKRTAVTSSNDRNANQETNFLLQRLESFSGICILTTNHEPAIDEAFRRRLSVHVRFPVPEEEERERLWHALLPSSAPVAPDLELQPLARKYVMGGGYIRNAVVRAAFVAADANEPISNHHLRHAAQLEYEAIGKLA
ncbi:MAG: ATP-binding protein [Deltaproteobacteria bacterium]